MKKLTVLIISSVFALAAMYGCQSTPEKPVVIRKDSEQMLEKADDGEIRLTNIEFPEKYTSSFKNQKGNISVTAEAEISVPSVQRLPLYSVSLGKFSQQTADKVMSVLLKGNTLYKRQLPKSAIKSMEEKLAILKKEKEEGSGEAQYAEGHSVDTAIASLELEIREAKANDGSTPASTEFVTDPESGYENIEGTATVDGRDYFFEIRNWTDAENQIYVYFIDNRFDRISSFSKDQSAEPGISSEAAAAGAEEILSSLDVDYMSCSYSEAVKSGNTSAWRLCFMRSYDGVPSTYTTEDGTLVGDEESYSAPWGYERAELLINGDGLIAFNWRNPYDNIQKIADDTAIIDFDEVISVFEKMIIVENSFFTNVNNDISIDKITLGMMRIIDSTDNSRGLIVPVWDFFGSYNQYLDGEPKGNPIKSGADSLLTINAIDGTVINRGRGY